MAFKTGTSPNVSRLLRISFLTLLILAALPFLTLTTIAILVYRELVKLYAELIYSNFGHPLVLVKNTSQPIVFDYLEPKPRANLFFCLVFDGQVKLDLLRETVVKILESTRTRGGIKSLKYPELQCHPVNILGYFFWRFKQNFDIENYVRKYDTKIHSLEIDDNDKDVTTKTKLEAIISKLMSQEWKAGQSPWEFLLIHNFVDDGDFQGVSKSLVVFRCHHFLADGFSIEELLRLLRTNVEGQSSVKKIKSNPGIPGKARWLQLLSFILLSPYRIADMLDQIFQKENHCWKVPKGQSHRTGHHMHQVWSELVPVETIKKIKNTHNTSFTAVLITILAGAINKLIKRANQPVPPITSAILPVPAPRRPKGLRNHFGFLKIRLPTKDCDSLGRLKLVTDELKQLEHSHIPLLSFILYHLVGLYPSIVTKYLVSWSTGISIGLSILPGHANDVYFMGDHQQLDGLGTVGAGTGCIGAFATAISQFENVRFGLNIDHEVYSSQQDLDALGRIISEEVESLENSTL